MKTRISLLIIFFCLSAICSNAQDKTAKEITIASFETVVTEGGGDFYFHYSSSPKVELKGTGSCTEKTSVEVISNVLNITSKGGFSENCKIEIHIYTPVIKEIQQNGGGRLVIKEGFAPVDVFKCSVDGGGELRMEALKVNSLFASIEGGGDIWAKVDKTLHGNIKGGGVIYYEGEPTVKSNISDGGTVRRK